MNKIVMTCWMCLIADMGVYADAYVKLVADKQGCEVYSNGDFVDTYEEGSPVEFVLAPGEHTIEVKKVYGDGSYDYFSKKIKVGTVTIYKSIKAELKRSYTEEYYFKRANTIEGAQAYLSAYPAGQYRDRLKNFIETEYAKKATDAAGAAAYLKKYPNGKFSDPARTFIKAEEARIAEDARKERERVAEAERKERERKAAQVRRKEEVRKAEEARKVQLAKEKVEARRVQVEEALKKYPFVADAPLELVFIPAGSFMMGANDGEDREKPMHRVTLTKPFFMAKTEVTQSLYEEVKGNNPSEFRGDDLPVEMVRWKDAVSFCEKLTKREQKAKRLPKGWEYSLPTEAQWEYACRAGSTGDYAGNLDAMEWYNERDDRNGTTHPVGTKQANAYGLHDMAGNVSEWCNDWYEDYKQGSVIDPAGANNGTLRVLRGGCWGMPKLYCRSANRSATEPYNALEILGFRPLIQQR